MKLVNNLNDHCMKCALGFEQTWFYCFFIHLVIAVNYSTLCLCMKLMVTLYAIGIM